jgi:hypothetical protein
MGNPSIGRRPSISPASVAQVPVCRPPGRVKFTRSKLRYAPTDLSKTRKADQLFAAQREHGINMRCSPRGQIGGKERDQQEQRSHAEERNWIE